jgi:hypothetical protein
MPYRDPGTYRPPRWHIALVNRTVGRLAALGLTPKNTICLEVPGRRSGQRRRTALVVAERGGCRYLLSLAGESEWVRIPDGSRRSETCLGGRPGRPADVDPAYFGSGVLRGGPRGPR